MRIKTTIIDNRTKVVTDYDEGHKLYVTACHVEGIVRPVMITFDKTKERALESHNSIH